MFRSFATSLGEVLFVEHADGDKGFKISICFPLPERTQRLLDTSYRTGDPFRVEIKALDATTFQVVRDELNSDDPDIETILELERRGHQGFLENLNESGAEAFVMDLVARLENEASSVSEEEHDSSGNMSAMGSMASIGKLH